MLRGGYYGTNSNGSGAGGGSFYGTRTSDVPPVLGFYGVAPLLSLRNLTAFPSVVQYASFALGAFSPDAFNGQQAWPLPELVIANVVPSSPDVTAQGGGWSYVLFYRPDGVFEAFAFVWTAVGSYGFVPAQTAFAVDDAGAVVEAGDTQLQLGVTSTAPAPPCGAPGFPAPFLSQVTLQLGSYPAAARSALLQQYVLGG